MSMNESQVADALKQAFIEEGHRIVLWNDEEGSYADEVQSLVPDGVTLIRLPGISMFEAKIRMEIDEPEQRFLVYDSREEPPLTEDWLLDIREYGRRFSADRPSELLGKLGLERMSLKDHLKLRENFLKNKQRVERLARLVEPADLEEELDRKMIAVMCKAVAPDLNCILRQLFAGLVDPYHGGLDQTPEGWADIGKFGLEESFWKLIEKTYGYEDDSPNLKALLLRILVSDLLYRAGDEIPGLNHLLLPDRGRRHARVFLAQWSDSQKHGEDYDAVAKEAQTALHLTDALKHVSLDTLRSLDTFPCIERAVLRLLVTQIREQWQTPHVDDWLDLIKVREEKHWVRPDAPVSTDWRGFHLAYRAVKAAVNLIDIWLPWRTQPWPSDVESMWEQYTSNWWQIDQAYRHFSESAEEIEHWDILKNLRHTIEDIYNNGYLTELGLQWGKAIAPRIADWQVQNVKPQHQFFKTHVKPRLDEGDRQKAMVIISDAFRYEAAKELVAELNSRYRFEAQIEEQLGVLPSYTTLGMASLLPHKKLAYAADGKTMKVDDMPAASTEQRNSILSQHEGMAIQADELLSLTKNDGRTRLEGARLAYVYHNRVDAAGDSSSTEEKTFMATRDAINELALLVNKAVNDFNYSYVVVTADHGFLFSHSSPNQTDKSKLAQTPTGALVAKKRFIIGHDLPKINEAWGGNTAQTAQTDPGMDFLIPKGTNLFHFVGGSRYVHGGAMPQEIVVPVVKVRALRGNKAETTRTSNVRLQVLGTTHRITTSSHRFKIIQTDPVTERMKAVSVRVDIRDGDVPVSNCESLTFDSQSETYDERIREIRLTLNNVEFDRQKVYTLAIRDAETGVTMTKADVHIDRAFTDDF